MIATSTSLAGTSWCPFRVRHPFPRRRCGLVRTLMDLVWPGQVTRCDRMSQGRRIPVIADAYVDRESGSWTLWRWLSYTATWHPAVQQPRFGTGALKITPAHDFNDFEIGQRHGLENHTVREPQERAMHWVYYSLLMFITEQLQSRDSELRKNFEKDEPLPDYLQWFRVICIDMWYQMWYQMISVFFKCCFVFSTNPVTECQCRSLDSTGPWSAWKP